MPAEQLVEYNREVTSDREEIREPDSKDKIQIIDAITTVLPSLKGFRPDIPKNIEGDENTPLLTKNDFDEENGLFNRWAKPFRKKETKT